VALYQPVDLADLRPLPSLAREETRRRSRRSGSAGHLRELLRQTRDLGRHCAARPHPGPAEHPKTRRYTRAIASGRSITIVGEPTRETAVREEQGERERGRGRVARIDQSERGEEHQDGQVTRAAAVEARTGYS